MNRKRVAAALICAMTIAWPAWAGELSASIERAAASLSANQAARERKPNRNNPYLWPGVALIGAGSAIALYGFTHVTGGEINCGDFLASTLNCKASETHATGVGIAGLAVVGFGGVLLWQGAKKAGGPSVTVAPGRIIVRHRLLI
jgi:hypothetical protein